MPRPRRSDEEPARARPGRQRINEGDLVTIDGTSGTVYIGGPAAGRTRPVPELEDLLTWADEIRQLGVWANADTADDAATARGPGAEGIGLARTEHMFMGERTGDRAAR